MLLVAVGQTILLEGITGPMGDDAIEDFESSTLFYLRKTVQSLPGAYFVEFEAVRVTNQKRQENQSLRRLSTKGGLLVTFDVAALVGKSNEELLNFDKIMTTFFNDKDVVQPLKNELMIANRQFDPNARSTSYNDEDADDETLEGKTSSRNIAISAMLTVV